MQWLQDKVEHAQIARKITANTGNTKFEQLLPKPRLAPSSIPIKLDEQCDSKKDVEACALSVSRPRAIAKLVGATF